MIKRYALLATTTALVVRGLLQSNYMYMHANFLFHRDVESDAVKFEFKKSPFDMRNLHENFPLTCGELPSVLHPSIEPLLHMYYNDREATPIHAFRFNEGGHGNTNNLTRTQVCLYDALHRWRTLAKNLGIQQWATHGGSAIGAKCFGSLNPWDDDIDLTVVDCTALDTIWEAGAKVADHYPSLPEHTYAANNSAVIFDARLIVDEDLILTKGHICCPWYKLMTVKQAFEQASGDNRNIGGIDIECMSRRLSGKEAPTKRKSKWISHMRSNGTLHDVMFGPTKIQMVPPHILDLYTSLRYGKESPCRYPYDNGVFPESVPIIHAVNTSTSELYLQDIKKSSMDYAVSTWYIPGMQRMKWREQAGNKQQKELTKSIPNLDEIEIDNSISAGCDWGIDASLKLIGWNAERGKYWDKFLALVHGLDVLRDPHVILLNEMDIGMARSYNIHTTRRLAMELGMNYAFGLEFVELTRGTLEEQNATVGHRNALGLHGNAILSKCFIGDAMVLRDPLPDAYFSNKPVRGINANGFEIRLGGRMGLFARIFQNQSIELRHSNPRVVLEQKPHFVVGNAHKLAETDENRIILWDYFGFGDPPQNSTKYEGTAIDPEHQLGVIIQGDFGPQFCSLGGLQKMNNYHIHKTFPVKCGPQKVDFGVLSGDFFCSNMKMIRNVHVSAPCDYSADIPITLSDHAIVSIVVKANS